MLPVVCVSLFITFVRSSGSICFLLSAEFLLNNDASFTINSTWQEVFEQRIKFSKSINPDEGNLENQKMIPANYFDPDVPHESLRIL